MIPFFLQASSIAMRSAELEATPPAMANLSNPYSSIAHMETSRCADTEQLKGEFAEVLNCPVEVFQTVEEGWKHFLENQGDGLAFCAGSLYLIGEVKSLLKPKEAEDD